MGQPTEPADEIIDEWLERCQIEDPPGVGQRTLGDPRQAHAPANSIVLENVLDRAKAGNGRVEENNEMCSQNVVGERFAIPTHRLGMQARQLVLEHANRPASHDGFPLAGARQNDVARAALATLLCHVRSAPKKRTARKLRSCKIRSTEIRDRVAQEQWHTCVSVFAVALRKCSGPVRRHSLFTMVFAPRAGAWGQDYGPGSDHGRGLVFVRHD